MKKLSLTPFKSLKNIGTKIKNSDLTQNNKNKLGSEVNKSIEKMLKLANKVLKEK